MNRKHLTKLTAIILILALCVSIFPIAAMADSAEKPYKAVFFGDSMAQGYMLEDYSNSCGGIGSAISEQAYPKQMTKWLEEKLGTEVQSKYFTVQGMRQNELYAMLEPEALDTMDFYTHKFVGHYTDHFNDWFIKQGMDPEYGITAADTPASAFGRAIEEADLVVLDMGMNYIGNYLIRRLGTVFAEADGEVSAEYSNHYTELIGMFDKSMAASLEELRLSLVKLLRQYHAEKIDVIVDAMLYAYGSYMIYFDKCIDEVTELNKAADIIVVSSFSCFPGINIDIDGRTFPMGTIFGMLYNALNVYAAAVSPHRHEYKLADCYSGGMETFIDAIDKGSYSPSVVNFILDNVYNMESEGLFAGYADEGISCFADILVEDVKAACGSDAAAEVAALLGDCQDVSAQRSLILDAYNNAEGEAMTALKGAFCEILRAHTEAMSGRLVNFSGLFGKPDAGAVAALRDISSAGADDKVSLATHIISCNKFVAMHPSPAGCATKLEYMKAAYESGLDAQGVAVNNLTRSAAGFAANTARYLTDNAFRLINSVLKSLFDIGSSVLRTYIAQITGA